MTVLVAGATGNVGGIVVRRLASAGVPVRGLTRNPDAVLPAGVEKAVGDLSDARTLAAAFDGVSAVQLFINWGDQSEVVELAVRAGVRRIVLLSSDGTPDELLEGKIRESGLEWTIMRPGEFAVNKIDIWGPAIRAGEPVREAYPDIAGVPVHEEDIADVAVAALTGDGHHGRTHVIRGPEALTHREQIRLIGEAVGREVKIEEVGHDEARADMITNGFPEEVADHILDYFVEWVDTPPPPVSLEAIIGRPGRTFAQWARDHAPAFSPVSYS
ncbi:NAD(P)H-binding protein [Allokutzneria sp. A3M-2-11 16]|uniref:SDR family oxidoreductase n=1 Tax=Allokutzneria sp. A3M-2-11 16 TaxID=2962043 RepID=UPI0020B664E4|nr:NAD(P)H-binding protein [Allokutzneria sp. A3M-2-11 16]MCP3798009.1 NAD(P)H-binding protein [Allokutzneria sp. A3M-2-11 16]